MRETFGRASEIVVNLGRAANGSELLPNMLQRTIDANRQLEEEIQAEKAMTAVHDQRMPLERQPEFGLPAVDAPDCLIASELMWKSERGAHHIALIEYTKALRELDPSSDSFSLVNLLHHCRSAEATDPRDLVFALLGLSKEADAADLAPNYAETTRETHIRYATYLAQHGSGPALLLNSFFDGNLRDSSPDVPSLSLPS